MTGMCDTDAGSEVDYPHTPRPVQIGVSPQSDELPDNGSPMRQPKKDIGQPQDLKRLSLPC